jgi:hypothetical protein
MTREKGVATAPCPDCGKDRPLEEQPDGALAAQTCSKCFPKKVVETAELYPASTRETGTHTEKEH